MAKIARQRFLGQAVWAIYCILTVFGLLALRNTDIVAYAIFGLFGIMSMIASSKFYSQYREIKENGLPPFDESQFSADEESYRRYCEVSIPHRCFNRKCHQYPNGSTSRLSYLQ